MGFGFLSCGTSATPHISLTCTELVQLLASALGVTTQPWKKPPETHADMLLRAPGTPDTAPFFENKTNAEAHFLAAKKRLGFLGDSLLDIQCLFLAFIYEKTYFRHLQEWLYLQQATARVQVRLLKTGTRPWANSESSGSNDLHIEQRVFWSCFRAKRFVKKWVPNGLSLTLIPESFYSR